MLKLVGVVGLSFRLAIIGCPPAAPSGPRCRGRWCGGRRSPRPPRQRPSERSVSASMRSSPWVKIEVRTRRRVPHSAITRAGSRRARTDRRERVAQDVRRHTRAAARGRRWPALVRALHRLSDTRRGRISSTSSACRRWWPEHELVAVNGRRDAASVASSSRSSGSSVIVRSARAGSWCPAPHRRAGQVHVPPPPQPQGLVDPQTGQRQRGEQRAAVGATRPARSSSPAASSSAAMWSARSSRSAVEGPAAAHGDGPGRGCWSLPVSTATPRPRAERA